MIVNSRLLMGSIYLGCGMLQPLRIRTGYVPDSCSYHHIFMTIYFNQLSQVTVTAKYEGENIDFSLWHTPLWQWCTEILNNKELMKNFQFDAMQVFRFNGTTFERCYDEPWTADLWWKVQVRVSDSVVNSMLTLSRASFHRVDPHSV